MYDFLKADDLSQLRKFSPSSRDEYLNHVQAIYNLKLHTDFPLVVHVETTNYCNQKCIMCCHPTMKRKPVHISDVLAKKALDECAKMNVWFVHFFFFGEPFINKNTLELMKYAKKVVVRQVSVTSNMTLISKKEIEELVDSKIDSIHVSIDGHDRESYKRIRKTDHYDKVVENLDYLLEYKKKTNSTLPWTSVTFVRSDQSDEEVEIFKNQWSNKVNDLHISPQFEYRNGSENGERRQEIGETQVGRNDENIMFYKEEDRVPCRQLWTRLVVLSNGELVPCSQNIDGELSLGNVKDISLHEAWTGNEMADLRMQHISNSFCGTRGNACKNCTDWDWSGKFEKRPVKK